MDSADSMAPDKVRFQLVLPPDLVEGLSRIPGVTVEHSFSASERVQHELALETVVVITTILINLDKLAPTIKRISEYVHRYFSESESQQPRVKVIGEQDETVIEIRLSDVDKTAKAIRVVVKR